MLGTLTGRLVAICARRPWPVLALAALLTLGSAAIVATRLGIDTSTEEMISTAVPFRQREVDFDRAFPQFDDLLVVVIDAATPAAADQAAAALAQRLEGRDDLFRRVSRPDSHPYFRQYGVLFLPPDQVFDLADRIIAAQPMLGTLAADPSLRGLLDVLGLALDAAQRGETDATILVERFAPVAAAIESVLSGRPEPIAWARTFGDAPADPRGSRRLILVQPVLDAGSLAPGGRASAALRAAAADLDVSVRLTGGVALDDEELASVARGAEWGLGLSFALVTLLLVVALREARLIGAILATMVAGLIATTGFAALAVGTLNLISVAFGIMFVGIAVDFGIQFCTRYRGDRRGAGDPIEALARVGQGIGGAMILAGLAIAAGFLAFLPTRFDGVAELGLISGVGMAIALVLNLTLLPALIALLRPQVRASRPVGRSLAALDSALAVHSRLVLATFAALALGSLVALTALRFDMNPLHLKDPDAQSVATLQDLLVDPLASPYALNVLVANATAAADLAARARALAGVARTQTLADFVPPDQDAKLAPLADAAIILGPTLSPPAVAEPPDPDAVIAAMTRVAEQLLSLPGAGAEARRLANALDAAADRGPSLMPAIQAAVIGDLATVLADLRALLTVGPVTAETLPADLAADWRAADGRVRVAIYPEGRDLDNTAIAAFVASVRGIAPDATGMAASIVDSGAVVVDAFLTASLAALAAIVVLLGLALRRALDVTLILAPLLLAGLLTMGGSVILGLPINFTNIIGLPLLLGIGVSFPTYLVIGWRAGAEGVLQTGTARAVLYSAATTASAFGSLALSGHPGTADMGAMLLLAIGALLVCNLIGLPALLAVVRR